MIKTIKIGDQIPNVYLHTRNGAHDKLLGTHEIFEGKRILLVSTPGPFLVDFPSKMVHGYNEKIEQLKNMGIDEVYLTSNCDFFSLRAWQKRDELNDLQILPDGNSDWVRSIGFLVDLSDRGLGARSHRYVMIVDNLVVKKVFYEDITADSANCFLKTNVETIIEYLIGIKDTWAKF